MEDENLTYDDLVTRGWASFDNQSECEDFIRWAIDEIKKLQKQIENLKSEIRGLESEAKS